MAGKSSILTSLDGLKLIDEYNYVTFTLRGLRREREKRRQKGKVVDLTQSAVSKPFSAKSLNITPDRSAKERQLTMVSCSFPSLGCSI